MDNIQKRKYISKVIGGQIDREIRRKKAASDREAYEASDEYKEYLAKSRILQNNTIIKTKENDNGYALLCEEATVIYNKIVKELKLDTEPNRDIPLEEIIDVILKYENDLDHIEKLSEIYHKPAADITLGTPYERLYANLVKLNPRFVYFAPKFAINKSEIKFNRLPSEELNGSIVETLDSFNLLSDSKFKKEYIHLFEKHVKNITDLDIAKKALRLYPQQYPNLSDNIKSLLEEDFLLLDIFKSIPTIGKYMSKQELKRMANIKPTLFATKLVANPEILEKLDNNFFKPFRLTEMFQTVSKKKILETCSAYFEKHPLLKEYAYSTHRQHCHSQPKILYENKKLNEEAFNV